MIERLFVLLLALCLGLGQQASAEGGHSLTIGLPSEPPNLDPTVGSSAAVSEVALGNLYEGLTRIAEDGQVLPCLAEDWNTAPDGLTYIFHLRPDVTFHDGARLTAADVKFSLDRARAADSANGQRMHFAAIAEVVAADDLTVVLHLDHPDPDLPFILGWSNAVIVSPASAAGLASMPIGTGPFRLGAWRRGDSLELDRHDGYWGRRPRADRVFFKFIGDPSAAFGALKAGNLDAFVNYPSPETVAQFRADPDFEVALGRSPGKIIVALNNGAGPFSDPRVRQAASYAIDRQAIIDGAMFGMGEPIGSHYSRGAAGYVDVTGRYPHDVAHARALLREAGYPDGAAVTMRLLPRAYARRSGEMVAAQLSEAGFKVTIETLELTQWLDQVFKNHHYDLSIVEHVEPLDYPIFGRDDYYFGYHSDIMKELLSSLDATAAQPARLRTLAEIQRLIADDAVVVPLLQTPRITIWRQGVAGLRVNAPISQNPVADAFKQDWTGNAGASMPSPGGRAARIVSASAVLLLVLLAGRSAGWRFVAGRLGILAATLLGASLLVFLLLQILPGDPASFMMGLDADPQALAALRRQMGLDVPLGHRYLSWIAGMVQGDFGLSASYRVGVGGLIADRLQVSVPLALTATLLSLLLAFPLGLLAAARRHGWVDGCITAITQLGIALPNFWLAMLLVLVFSIGLKLTPAGGFSGWAGGARAAAQALILPVIALALPQAAILTRVLRGALLETLGEEYMRTARAKGLSDGQALRRHALPNALIPLLSVIGLQMPYLLAGSIIVENVFSLPGLGRLVFQAIGQRDLMVVQGVVMVLAAAVVGTTFSIDLAYSAADPRLRRRGRP